MIYPVVLCGGSGVRLWPKSRSSFPKQFIRMNGEQTLFQSTVRRITGDEFADPHIVTSEEFRFVVTEQLEGLGVTPSSIILEPIARNTAPAILAACLCLIEHDAEATLLIAPSDHIINDTNSFRDAVFAAVPGVNDGLIATFGIAPTKPETGFGYLELGERLNDRSWSLKSFVEKPALEAAISMIASNEFLWNSGIFLFRADVMLDAFLRYYPEMVETIRRSVELGKSDMKFFRPEEASWKSLPDISIDYAIMEAAENLCVIPYNGDWADLGSWSSVADHYGDQADRSGNVTIGPSYSYDCENTFLHGDDPGPVLVGVGLNDVVAVSTGDAVLISSKSHAQKVRDVVFDLKELGVMQTTQSLRDFRPWGWFETLAHGPAFNVKKIVVNPGQALSLQSHKYRAEHWIIVEGVAAVTISNNKNYIHPNESVYVPAGEIHRLENEGDCLVVVIEVQTGSYFGEDDIVRYSDVYDRA